MTLIWLIVWLVNSSPDLYAWNAWAIGLCVCMFIDFTGACIR